ncbi:MAG: pyrroloquinoline quinone biosynthesis protein PqqD [Candidatus Dadabacteria bacterium]
MSPNDRFRINSPKISHETIDGETVIINLDNGNYYSLIGVGADVWRFIEIGATIGDIIAIIKHQYVGAHVDIENDINRFISELQEEGLVVDDKGRSSEGINGLIETGLSEKKPIFEAPVLNKYTDMQDLLLLDPIHEVDETGWPTPKLPEEE